MVQLYLYGGLRYTGSCATGSTGSPCVYCWIVLYDILQYYFYVALRNTAGPVLAYMYWSTKAV